MSIRRRLAASSVAVIAAAITVAAQSPGDRSQPTGAPSSSRPTEPTAPSPPTSATQPALPPAQPAPPSSATQTSTVVVPRSVAPDAGTPPAARAAPACGATDRPRASHPSSSTPTSSLPGVSADQFQRPGVPADAFVRPGVSAAQAGALLPGTPGAPCTPPRDVVLYPDTTPPRRLPPPQD